MQRLPTIGLLRKHDCREEASLVETYLDEDRLAASDRLDGAEMYEKFYFLFVTLEQWIHVKSSILSRDAWELSPWLVHAARHALGGDESDACRAQHLLYQQLFAETVGKRK